jgi:hypothetical protein
MTDPGHALLRFVALARMRMRARRALAAATFSLAAVCAGNAALSLLAAAGVRLLHWDAAGFLFVAVLSAFAAALAAALWPVEVRTVTRSADRQLGLEGALATAFEVVASPDPFKRLLVRRTAAALGPIRPSRAVPLRPPPVALLVPALLALAFLLGPQAATAPASSDRGSVPLPSDPVLEQLSHDLREIAVTLLRDPHASSPSAVDRVRRLVTIDEALRRGALDPKQVRLALEQWMTTLDADGVLRSQNDPRDLARLETLDALSRLDARASAAAGRGAQEGRATERDETAGARAIDPTQPDQAAGGQGEEAGRRSAPLGFSPHGDPVNESGPGIERTSPADAAWVLPPPARLSATADAGWPEGARESPVLPQSAGRDASVLALSRSSLTGSERALLDEYFRVLVRERGKLSGQEAHP